MNRTLKRLTGATLAVLALGAGAVVAPWPRWLAAVCAPDPDALAAPADTVYTDRTGQPLRHRPGPKGLRGDWTPLPELPPRLVNAFLAAEDCRFRTHPGFDARRIARAAFDNLTHRRVVSGASTITGQLVRILEPRPRTLRSKVIEAARSVAIEKVLTKDQILEQYLNRVPMPGNVRGVTSAARLLFDRAPDALTLGQSALLASLPQSPTRFDPRRLAAAGAAAEKDRARLLRRWNWVLDRMVLLNLTTAAERAAVGTTLPALAPVKFPFAAPHLVDHLEHARRNGIVKTTLDPAVQAIVERVLASHRLRLRQKGARQAACVVLDNATAEVLAWVGSLGWEPTALGYNDGVLARRSAGSAVKPFAYATALEQGFNLGTLLADVNRTFSTPLGDYDPQNFDRRENGPVLLRTALGSSLNQAAVELARLTGVEPIGHLLAHVGLLDPRRDPNELGLGIVIGNAEITLLDLAAAYATLARGGVFRRPSMILGESTTAGQAACGFSAPVNTGGGWSSPALRTRHGPLASLARTGQRAIEPDIAYLIGDVLADPAARLLTFGTVRAFQFPFPVALKTGTSTSYRDSWTAGWTGRYTVAVWCGNFDGRPTGGVSGATGAAPVFADVVRALHASQPPHGFARPPGIVERDVCATSGGVPNAACATRIVELFAARKPAPAPCTIHRPGSETAALPPAYASWVAKREASGLGRFALDAADTRAVGGIEIAQPHQGDRFVMPRRAPAPPALAVRAVPRRPVPYLIWFVDGRELARTPPPYRWDWPMERGGHDIVAATPDLAQSAVVKIHIE